MTKRLAASDYFTPELKRSCSEEAAAPAQFAAYNPRCLAITQFPFASEIQARVPGMTAITNALAHHIERALDCPNVCTGTTKDVLWLRGGSEAHIVKHVANFCNSMSQPITLVEYRVADIQTEVTNEFWHYVYTLCSKAAPCVLAIDHISGRAPPQAVVEIVRSAHVAYFIRKEAALEQLPAVWTVFIDTEEPPFFFEKNKASSLAEYVVPSEQEQRDAVMSHVKERLLRVTSDGSAIERKLAQADAAVASVFRIHAESVASLNASQLVSAQSTLHRKFSTSAGIREFVDNCLTRSIERKFQLARLSTPSGAALEFSLLPDEEDYTALATRIADGDTVQAQIEARLSSAQQQQLQAECPSADDAAMFGWTRPPTKQKK
jgi:hypothetical protein